MIFNKSMNFPLKKIKISSGLSIIIKGKKKINNKISMARMYNKSMIFLVYTESWKRNFDLPFE
jgi:hypothetical protein